MWRLPPTRVKMGLKIVDREKRRFKHLHEPQLTASRRGVRRARDVEQRRRAPCALAAELLAQRVHGTQCGQDTPHKVEAERPRRQPRHIQVASQPQHPADRPPADSTPLPCMQLRSFPSGSRRRSSAATALSKRESERRVAALALLFLMRPMELNDIVVYDGRRHIVVGFDPMSVNPQRACLRDVKTAEQVPLLYDDLMKQLCDADAHSRRSHGEQQPDKSSSSSGGATGALAF
jgi:hypothetical protein